MTNQILLQLSSQLASLSVSNSFINSTSPSFTIPARPFVAQSSSVTINTLWSCSLAISLITASLGILVKQWFHEFMAQETQDPHHRIRIRFFRSEGLERWQVFEIAAALPLLLQFALVLFFIGFSIFLRELNPVVGWTTTMTFITWLIIFVFTTFAPAVSSQCPYKTPILKGTLQSIRPKIQPVYGSFQKYVIGGICHTSTAIFSHTVPFVLSLVLSGNSLMFSSIKSLIRLIVASREHSTMKALISNMVPSWFVQSVSTLWGSVDLIAQTLPRAISVMLSGWAYSPFPEEDKIRESKIIDLDIVLVSVSFFQDDQIRRTLEECVEDVKVEDIMEFHDEIQSDSIASETSEMSSWRVEPKQEARLIAEGVVRKSLIIKCGDLKLGEASSWYNTLTSFVTPGGTWWRDLPMLITTLIRSDSEYGGITAFLVLYSLVAHDEESLCDQLWGNFNSKDNTRQGDAQCMYLFLARVKILVH